ncbi:hypothetical protein DFJ73DRAFT_794810 [Zopfochytrium polystomum]|nr:hypothetical protein DFJ73DRAFT_794810 [Zopfochytrium polystomum]
MINSPIAPLRRSRSPVDRPFRRSKPWRCRQPPATRAQRPALDKVSIGRRRTLLLLVCFLSLAADLASSSSIAWKDMAALVSLDNVGLFSINGRTGTSTTRFGPFYSPTVDAFGMEEFTTSTANLWFVDSRTAEISTAVNQKASDLRFGFSCVKDNVLPRFYCTGKNVWVVELCNSPLTKVEGGFTESLKTTDIPFYTIDMKDQKMKISRVGFSQRPPGKSVEYIGRGLHASALIGNKLFLFGGLSCLFCKKPMWDVSTTAVIDITDPLKPTHKWLKGSSKGTTALQQFAGSCAVGLPNGRALIIGGLTINATGQAAALANVLWQFDPASASYTAIPTKSGTAPSPGWGMSCALSTDAKSVFVHGGCDPSCVASDEDAVGGNGGPKDAAVYKLDVASVTRGGAGAVWTKIPDATGAGPGPRCFASAAAYRDLFIVVGGQQKLSSGDGESLGVAGKKSKKTAAAATTRSVGLWKGKSPTAEKKSKKVSSDGDEDKKRPSKGKEPKTAEPKAKATAAKAGTSLSVGSNLGALKNVKEKSAGHIDDDKL